MSEVQPRAIVPPSEELKDFAEVIDSGVKQLFDLAHQHLPRTTAPTDDEGQVGDIVGVEIEGSPTTFKLYFRFASGWKSVTLS